MKRTSAILVVLVCALTTTYGQTGSFQEASGERYRVFSEVSMSNAQETADMMDAFFELYNRYLHFDPVTLSSKLRIRIFANKTSFDSYLSSIIPEKRDSFVYLQYKDLSKSELLGFYTDEDSFRKALVHHGSIQFLKAFIPNPPLWMQKGFAVFFEKSTYDPQERTAEYNENLAWLKTLKSIANLENGATLIDLETLLTIDVETANNNIESFYAESWGLISFLYETPIKKYNRILWDSISVLDPAADLMENSRAVLTGPFGWASEDDFYGDFQRYVAGVKTFPELVREGMAYYSDRDFDQAEKAFLRAVERNDKHHIPYYYLGLINYSRGEYSLAEYYYLTTQQMGGEPGLTYYALGVNAYADDRYQDALDYLTQAKDLNPSDYGEKSNILLERIRG